MRRGNDELVQTLETVVQSQAEEERAQRRSEAEQEESVPKEGRAERKGQVRKKQEARKRPGGEQRKKDDQKKDAIPPTHPDYIYTPPRAR